ncbi:putative TPR repeat family protein [Spironucleus salmonicida]|uniref:Putative PEP-CTERM system TPR-repeat-containing protein n=1 Tax=Spironucleus salmonicida TaxID=348837 RepID=V6LFA3_9EUKA|nr:putative TPR repeat family protein [Spironucleus salmonicida]|eukprot:EST42973.1 Putative PEP-CTERM system TPR-repeat-containing protein [Spironucleus salmonicida]
MQQLYQVPEGQLTRTIYKHIENQEFDEAINVLKLQLQMFPNNSPACSILAYCYYHKGEFDLAIPLYEQLVKKYPDSERYQLSLANSRYKADMLVEALQLKIDSHDADVLRAYCKHDIDDSNALQNLVEKLTKSPTDDPRVFALKANLLLKQEKFQEAIDLYDAANEICPDPRIFYAKAVAFYRQSDYPHCLKTLGDLVDLSAKKYPELVQAAQSFNGAGEVESQTVIQNLNHLLGSALIDAFNLKASIEWNLGDEYAANRALKSMPYRKEEDLDPVTLHNLALSEMMHQPSQAVKKLQFLIQVPPFPVEAFQNLINIYIQHGLFDLAADLMAENQQLSQASLEPEKQAFFQAVVQSIASPEEAYSQLDQLKQRYANQLRRIRQEITQTRSKSSKNKQAADEFTGRFNTNEAKTMSKEEIAVNTLLQQYEQKLGIFIPVITWQTSILYNLKRYKGAYHIICQYEDLIEDHPSYKINQANILFANEDYADALEKYQEVVDTLGQENILDVPAIAVANLCVCYVLNSQNNLAEQLMQKVDTAQTQITNVSPESSNQLLHLSITNIVLGALYAINQNMPFGIRRIIAAMEPTSEKLSPDSWLYVKRPLVSLAEACSMNLGGPAEEQLIDHVLLFLDEVIKYGEEMSINPTAVGFAGVTEKNISEEARALKSIYLQLM